MSWTLVLEHLYIVLAAGILSVIVGLPLGVLAYVYPKARGAILWLVDLLQTIPSLALLGIIMVFIGAGKTTVILGITLYSLLPIVRNTYLGLQQVDGGIKEAARGMGMTQGYRIFHVEFPLAFPMVFTGIRLAVVNAIGSAVFAAFVGGGGLGSIINRGIRISDMKLILIGTGVLMVIAVVLDLFMGWFEQYLKKTGSGKSSKKIIIPAVAVLLAVVIAIPIGLNQGDTDRTLVLYNGDYTETQVMHHMTKLLVEAHTDLSVTVKDQMSQVNNYKELINGGCDLMVSYDGTLLTTFLKLDPEDVPAGDSIYSFANRTGEERHDIRLLEKLGFDNTYAVAVPQAIADQYQLNTVSDLVPVANQLVFGAEQEFFTLEGSMKYDPFVKFYGLSFKDSIPVDAGLKYTAIEKGNFQVTEVYATDGLNRKAGLKVLEDDKSFFPDYNGAYLVRNDTFTRFANVAPNLEEVLNLLSGQIANDDMVELTYQVDVMGRTIDEVCREFLQSRGLLSGQ